MAEKLFLKSPYLLRSAAASINGWRIDRVRYGGNYSRYLKEIENRMLQGPDAVNHYVQVSLQQTLEQAYRNVPYYRHAFKQSGVDLNREISPALLSSIPFLEKEIIRQDPTVLVDSRLDLAKLHKIHTTGTTGTPLVIYFNEESRRRNYAYFSRFLRSVGISERSRRITLGGRLVLDPDSRSDSFWVYSAGQKNLLMSSYHLSEENLPKYINKIKQFQPAYIDSYPSSLATIADFAVSNSVDLTGCVKGIITSAETLYAEQRKTIETAFGVTVHDQYGAAEMCVFIAQCSEGHYHVHNDYGYIEFLNDDALPASPGEQAEVVCTSFINPVMPLIRYRIGDKVVLADDTGSCKNPFPIVEQLVGRIDDEIITPDGKKVGRLSPVVKGFPVREIQYVQSETDAVTIQVVKAEGFTEKTEAELRRALEKRLGTTIKLNFSYVPSIDRGSGGKLRSVVSLLKR